MVEVSDVSTPRGIPDGSSATYELREALKKQRRNSRDFGPPVVSLKDDKRQPSLEALRGSHVVMKKRASFASDDGSPQAAADAQAAHASAASGGSAPSRVGTGSQAKAACAQAVPSGPAPGRGSTGSQGAKWNSAGSTARRSAIYQRGPSVRGALPVKAAPPGPPESASSAGGTGGAADAPKAVAATRIQAVLRRNRAVTAFRHRQDAATRIQAAFRGSSALRAFRQEQDNMGVKGESLQEHAADASRQAATAAPRACAARLEDAVRTQKGRLRQVLEDALQSGTLGECLDTYTAEHQQGDPKAPLSAAAALSGQEGSASAPPPPAPAAAAAAAPAPASTPAAPAPAPKEGVVKKGGSKKKT